MRNKSRWIFEGFVRERSLKQENNRNTLSDEEFNELGRSSSGKRKWISELSPIANVVVGKCSRILGISMDELQNNFDTVASDPIKHPSKYARNFLEYCCFRSLVLLSEMTDHLADQDFRQLTYDMMLAWETPSASSQSVLRVDGESTVGSEAFCRIGSSIPIISDVITCDDLFDLLTTSTGGRLPFSVYDKYLGGLKRAVQKMKMLSESSLLSNLRSPRGEQILDIDGTVTTQPVLQHSGLSTWPGRLVLTDHALYFGALRLVTFDKATVYDLSNDLKQIVKPDLTGPLGVRLFDKALSYKSTTVSEPLVLDFPELKGHSRRDYWLAIIQEILYAHRFIRKFQIEGVERNEALSQAVLGILRLQAIKDILTVTPFHIESLLVFSITDELPAGDRILEALANTLTSRKLNRSNYSVRGSGMHSISAFTMVSNLGVSLGSRTEVNQQLFVGEITVGELSPLEKVVKEARNSFKKVELAQASVNDVKVDDLATNLALMKELLIPITEVVKHLLLFSSWNNPLKSLSFCFMGSYIIWRGWLGHAFALVLVFIAIFIVLTRFYNQPTPVVKVNTPPPMNTVEKILAIPNAMSQVEGFIRDGNIVLLKLRSLLVATLPQESYKVAVALVLVAMIFIFLPAKYIILLLFLEIFTRNSSPRKPSTEKFMRRMKEWWFSIPVASVIIETAKEDKKNL